MSNEIKSTEQSLNDALLGRIGDTFVTPQSDDSHLAKEMLNDLENLKRMEEDLVVRIPEVNFVQVFLPYFAGDEENPYDVDLSSWTTLVGSPFRKAYVVDAKGDILFTVPPMSDNTVFSPKGVRDDYQDHFPEVIGNLNNQRARSLIQGSQYFREFLKQYYTKLIDKAFVADHIIAWNEIFRRYDRPLIEINGLNNTSSINTVGDTDNGEILDEFDEL